MDNFPQFLRPQDTAKTEEYLNKMKNKVDKVIKSLYIETGTVFSLTHMFYVRKGFNIIRMVYNGTPCGLNLALWAPHFGLTISNIRFAPYFQDIQNVTWTWEKCF